ncbi:AAA family ATPase [Deltaproteobacteria bacterium]|nr:AAA family ATPase [Deltaproteobacteria bacterium]
MGNLLKIFKVPERSKIENTTVPGSETYPEVEQMIPGGKKPDIPGYSMEEVIFESSRSRIWRGKRQSDGLLVLIKGASSSEQSAQEQAEIIHEHEISRNLEIDGVLRPLELVACESGSALIMENTNCLPLRKLMDQAPLDLLGSLKVAVSLTSTLKEVHQQGIIHKMINPLNIFVDPALGTVKLTGFGQASRLPQENLTTLSPQLNGENLPYISPEQTGRMNRPLDYRSDFYSLGATLYELFTGRVPFESREDIEIIHGHIARQPLSLDKIEPQVPKILSRLVLKLMGKRTNDRYQVHSALLNDLQICVEQLEKHGHISEFPLAQLDIPKELQIVPGLYGREDEIAELKTVLDRVSQGTTEMVLVSGTAGVGKTSLVGEIQRSIAQKNGFFISGKFDQLRHNIPYSALIQGLRKLIREVSVGGKSVNESWKSRILAALGTSGHLMNQVIPELEQIIGPQPPLPEMGALETRNRFTAVLLDFIFVFCEKTHPLVIFLDDLQWVDADTLKLVERIAQDQVGKPLLLLGAYRDNEVEAGHRLKDFIEFIDKTYEPVKKIQLKPLNQENISRLLVHSCHCSLDYANPLAEFLLRKTGGNPFFVSQFLTLLSEKELIRYSPEEKHWIWELAAIEFLNITETDSVVEMLIERLQNLPAKTRRLLSLAACIGNHFDMESLELISNEGRGEIFENLLPALESELIGDFSNAKQLDNSKYEGTTEGGSYKFLHDRVQQAAYALIAQKEKQPVHLQIGQALLKKYAPEKSDVLLFDIVHHLNLARRVKDKWKDRSHLAELNLKAGRQARAASAFEQALKYFTIGLELLGDAAWKRQYPLVLSLHEEATEMSSLCGRFDLMEKLAGAVKDNARDDLDLANVYQFLIKGYMIQGKLKKALETGEEILEKLGCKLSPLSPDQWQQTLIQIKPSLVGKSVEEVMRFEPLTQTDAEVLVPILYNLCEAYGEVGTTLDYGLWQPLASKYISFLLNHFHPDYSPDFYCNLGFIYCVYTHDYEFGYELGRLGIQLMAALDRKEIDCIVSGRFNSSVRFFREPLSASLEPLREAHKIGIGTGNVHSASQLAVSWCRLTFLCGKELNWLKRELSTLKVALKKIDFIIGFPQLEMLMKTITILTEEHSTLSSGISDQYDRVTGAEYRHADQSSFNCQKLVLQYLFEEYEAARETVFEMTNLMKTYKDSISDPLANCYRSLALLAVCGQVSEGGKEEILTQVNENQALLEKLAHSAPPNYRHKHHLVEAERMRVLDDEHDTIMHHYDQAIALARESGFIHEEALADELAVRYLLSQGENIPARTYLQAALEKYEAWGSKRKVAHLKSRYPGLIADDRAEATSPSVNLDLATMLKASETISSTLELEPLLEILLSILMENAGAQTATLILETEGRSLIAARGSSEQVECFLPLSLPVEKGGGPLPVGYLLGETNPGTPGCGKRRPRGTVCRG